MHPCLSEKPRSLVPSLFQFSFARSRLNKSTRGRFMSIPGQVIPKLFLKLLRAFVFLTLSRLLLNNTHSTKNKGKRDKTHISISVAQIPINSLSFFYLSFAITVLSRQTSSPLPELPPRNNLPSSKHSQPAGNRASKSDVRTIDDSLVPQLETIRARLLASLSPGEQFLSSPDKPDQSRDIGRILSRAAPEDAGLTEIEVFGDEGGREENMLSRQELQRIVEERKRGRPLGLERQASGFVLFRSAFSCRALIP